jgi:hypothetical protein
VSADLEGRIDVTLTRTGNSVTAVTIRSSRPQLAQRLLAGRTPEEAAELTGMIFSLCGKAQRVAAQTACEAAREQTADEATMRERSARVLVELAQEHAWRLLLNWPEQAGLNSDMSALLALRQGAASPAGLADTLDTLLRTRFLGESTEDWLNRDLHGFDVWRESGRTLPAILFASLGPGADVGLSTTTLLPAVAQLENPDGAALSALALEDASFCACPLWHGQPAETGALARNLDHPLLADWITLRGRGAGGRMLARLLELARLPQRLRKGGEKVVHAQPLEDNAGMAAVETSRGLLIHVVRLANERVAAYRIIAPTEWNFHPKGPLAQALGNLSMEDATGEGLLARSRLVAQSLDPCVAYSVEVLNA